MLTHGPHISPSPLSVGTSNVLTSTTSGSTGRTVDASLQGTPGTLNADLALAVTVDAGLQGAAGTLNATVAPSVDMDASLQGAAGTFNADLSTGSTLTLAASLQGASGTLNASITEADVKRLATLNAKLTD